MSVHSVNYDVTHIMDKIERSFPVKVFYLTHNIKNYKSKIKRLNIRKRLWKNHLLWRYQLFKEPIRYNFDVLAKKQKEPYLTWEKVKASSLTQVISPDRNLLLIRYIYSGWFIVCITEDFVKALFLIITITTGSNRSIVNRDVEQVDFEPG